MQFSKIQPKKGDVVLHCGHLEALDHQSHFYAIGLDGTGEVEYVRPDKSTGIAKWLALCTECLKIHGDKPDSIIRGDIVWDCDDPMILEPENSEKN